MRIILANPRRLLCRRQHGHRLPRTVLLSSSAPPLYVFHEIVHNQYVVDRFRNRGVVFVDRNADAVSPSPPLIKQMFEPVDEPIQMHHFFYSQVDARHKRFPVNGIVADRECLTRSAEQHLLVGNQSGEPHAVEAKAVGVSPPCPFQQFRFLRVSLLEFRAAFGYEFCRFDGRPRRCVQLLVVVHFNNFHMGQILGCFLREFHHEHGPNGEVGRDDTAYFPLLGQLVQLRNVLLRPA